VFTHQGRLAGVLRRTMTNPATEKNDEIPSMDKHWIFYGEPTSLNDTRSLAQRVVLAISRILCLVAFGWPNLSPAWERSHSKDKDWEEGKDSLRKRIEHTNVVVSPFDSGAAGHSLIFAGRFASYNHRGLLQHRPTKGFKILSVHEGGPYVSHTPGLRTLLRGTHCWVCGRGRDGEIGPELVP